MHNAAVGLWRLGSGCRAPDDAARFPASLWQDIFSGEDDRAEKVKSNELKAVNFSSNVRNTQTTCACAAERECMWA